VTQIERVFGTESRVAIGAWKYSETFPDLARTDADGEAVVGARQQGAYMFIESAGRGLGVGDLRAFTRTGWADERSSVVMGYAGSGVVWSGFMSGRENDQLGIAIAHARMSNAWREAQAALGVATRAAESIVELTGRFALGEHIVLQPDVQYIHHPGAEVGRSAVWAVGLRIEMSAGFAR
jgi:porin